MLQTPVRYWENSAQVIEPNVTPTGVHVYPLNPVLPLQVRFLSLRAPCAVAPRRHTYFEILYMQSGGAVYGVPGGEIAVNQGDLFVVGSGLDHGIRQYLAPRIRAVVLYFDPLLIRGDAESAEGREYLLPFEARGNRLLHAVPASSRIPADVLDLILRIDEESMKVTRHWQLALKTYLKMILVLLLKHYAACEPAAKEHDQHHGLERLQPLFQYVEQNYAENISVEQASTLLRMSKSHFMRFFRTTTGMAFVAYLNRFRVSKAQHLIATTRLSIASVTQEVGFCDQSYFGVVFRRHVGMTPREYRDRRSIR